MIILVYDMASGGSDKLKGGFGAIAFFGDEDEATKKFIDFTRREPDNVTCSCCGSDFSVSTHDSVEVMRSLYKKYCKIQIPELEDK